MHPVKIRLTGMQRMHMNQTVMHMTAQSPAITKVISIKKCKAVKTGKKQRYWIPLLFCFWCSNLGSLKNLWYKRTDLEQKATEKRNIVYNRLQSRERKKNGKNGADSTLPFRNGSCSESGKCWI